MLQELGQSPMLAGPKAAEARNSAEGRHHKQLEGLAAQAEHR